MIAAGKRHKGTHDRPNDAGIVQDCAERRLDPPDRYQDVPVYTEPRLYGIKRPRPLRELVTASGNASFGYVRVEVLPDRALELCLVLHGPENIRVRRKTRYVVGRCVRDSTALRMALKFRDAVCKACRLNLT